MTEFRYILKNVKPRMRCPNPSCNRLSFSPYVDKETGEIVGEQYGVCSHRVSCGYSLYPTSEQLKEPSKIIKDIDTRKPFLLNPSIYEELKRHTRLDNFSTNLRMLFKNADEVLDKYGVVSGSQGAKYQNYTGFPYIQQDGVLKSVKMMMYGNDLHRAKDKEGNGIVNWLHYFNGFDKTKDKFEACWFGEQLIDTTEYDYIGIVESEKTCIVATCCVPSVLWLACGSIGNKKQIIGKGLKGKKVVFFPDANGFENWNEWVMNQRQYTWKVSKLPQTLSGGDDIADVLLKDANFGETILADIQGLFGELINKDALFYYQSLTATFTADDWNSIFKRNSMPFICESEAGHDDNGKYTEKIKFFRKNERKELNLLQVFTGQDLDDFCCEYHFPKYDDIKNEEFSLNFTPEMLMDFLQTYPKTYFNDFVFNVDEMTFNYKGKPFNLQSILSEKTKNIESSSINARTKIKLFKRWEPTIKEFCNFFEFTDRVKFQPQTLGIYDDIIQSGLVFCQNNGMEMNFKDWDKWQQIFQTIWNVDEASCMALFLFTIFNLQCRINYDTSNLRLLNIIGDGGVGKDSTLISLIIGCWRQSHSSRIWEGSTFGVSGFTSETPEKVNSYLLQVISDDLKAANASATFEQITNPLLRIENKGQQPIRVRRRFMQVNTNNNSRFSFEKLSKQNRDAFARRMLVMKVLSKSQHPDQLEKYKDLYRFFCKPENQTLFHGWWYWCYSIATDKANAEHLKNIDNFLYKEMRSNAEKYTYLNNEDDIILTELGQLCENSEYEDNFTMHNIIKRDVSGVPCYAVKSLNPLYDSLRQKFGKEKIKATISNKFGEKARFGSTIRTGDFNVSKVALIVPCEDVLEEDTPQQTDNTQPVFDLVSDLSKIVSF